jgi:hypothetical protein
MRSGALIGVCLLSLASPAQAQTGLAPAPDNSTLSSAETRELLDAARATAKAARENVDYARVVPDILFQILTKLDKIEDKLDKVENAIKRERSPRTTAR